jgi:hypothetical protein
MLRVFADEQMRARAIVRGTKAQNIDQRSRGGDVGLRHVAVQLLRGRGRTKGGKCTFFPGVGLRRLQNRSRQIFWSVCLRRRAVGETHTEFALQPGQQLNALEAAKSQLAIQVRICVQDGKRAEAAQLVKKFTHDFKNARSRCRAVELCSGRGQRFNRKNVTSRAGYHAAASIAIVNWRAQSKSQHPTRALLSALLLGLLGPTLGHQGGRKVHAGKIGATQIRLSQDGDTQVRAGEFRSIHIGPA